MDNMSGSQPLLTLIVAATKTNGIGKGGQLPWPMLKKEMAYFARVTKRVPAALKPATETSRPVQNVVIMGRKTWDSIPPKLRPLKDRTNVVITRQDPASLGISQPDVIVASSIPAAIAKAQQEAQAAVGRVYIIGGATIYDAALQLPNKKAVLLTRILRDYDCDTTFPQDLDQDAAWRLASAATLSEFVEEHVADEDMEERVGDESVRYRFQLYEQQ